MYIGNAMLVVLNLPLIGIWVKVLKIPYRIIFPMILLLCLIGAYAVSFSTFDLKLMLGFGILGYGMRKLDFDVAPFALAFVLGPLIEVSMRQALIISQGSFTVFLTRPISAICLGIACLFVLSNFLPFIKRKLGKLEEMEVK